MSLLKVQQWVLTAGITAVVLFPIGALIVTAGGQDRSGDPGNAIALSVMAGVIGLLAFAACRLVHRAPPMSPYLALGAIPGAAAVVWLLVR
ncbi:hypothetical protein [Aeromicrobium sp. CF3.5]|uniref:hypothetical protein n=1 Tax=Aeromicrobium sp. CF3.5 TaxID=3373078 RepID=UPI003EE6ADA0